MKKTNKQITKGYKELEIESSPKFVSAESFGKELIQKYQSDKSVSFGYSNNTSTS